MNFKGRAARVGEKGFSVSELLVVLMLFGIFMVIAVPNVTRWYSRYLLTNSCRSTVTMLKLARMKAVAQNRDYTANVTQNAAGQIKIEIYPAPPPNTTPAPGSVTEATNLHRFIRMDYDRFCPASPRLDTKFTYRSNGTAVYKDVSNNDLSSKACVKFSLYNNSDPNIFWQKMKLLYSGGIRVLDVGKDDTDCCP